MNAHTTIKGARPAIPAATMASLVPGFVSGRGYHSIFREHETNHCPGCGRSHWHVGRMTAECAFCTTAIPLEASLTRGTLERPVIVHRNMRRAA